MKLMRYKVQDENMGRAGTYNVLLCKVGPKWARVIFMDSVGIAVARVASSELNYMVESADSLRKALKKFKQAGNRFGITKAARVYINEALKNG